MYGLIALAAASSEWHLLELNFILLFTSLLRYLLILYAIKDK